MVASHNEDTVRFAIQKMDEIGILPEDKVRYIMIKWHMILIKVAKVTNADERNEITFN